MGLRNEGKINKLPPGDLHLGWPTAPISSLNEAWLHTLDRCINDRPSSQAILPLMRNCFWRSDPRLSLAAAGSWRSSSFGYCWLHYGRAAVVTPRAVHQLQYSGFAETLARASRSDRPK